MASAFIFRDGSCYSLRLEAGIWLDTAEQVAAMLLARQAWEEAAEVARLILDRDDCWQQAYRILMMAYDRMGNRSQALRFFRRCRERLYSELGVTPSPSTIQLFHSLLDESGSEKAIL